MVIHSTTDYGKFHLIKGNRHVSGLKVSRLAKTIEKKNLLYLFPIVVDKDGGVLDGQHRLAAAREVGVPVFYVIGDEDVSVRDIANTNVHTSSWNSEDYLNYHIENGNEDYIEFAEMLKQYPYVHLTVASVVLIGNNGNQTTYDFRDGKMVISPEKRKFFHRWANAVSDFEPYMPQLVKHSTFQRAIRRLLKTKAYDHETIIQRLDKGAPRVVGQLGSESDYIRHMEEVANFRRKKELPPIRFF